MQEGTHDLSTRIARIIAAVGAARNECEVAALDDAARFLAQAHKGLRKARASLGSWVELETSNAIGPEESDPEGAPASASASLPATFRKAKRNQRRLRQIREPDAE